MEFNGTAKRLSYDFSDNRITVTFSTDMPRAELQAQWDKIEKLPSLRITAKQMRQKRSLDSNAYYWQLLSQVAEALNISKPFAHNRFLRRYGQIEMFDEQAVYVVIPDTEEAEKHVEESETYHLKPTSQVKEGKDGRMYRTYMMLRGSSDYDSREMSKLIDGLVTEAKELGIETLTPDELHEMNERWGISKGCGQS